MLLPALAKSSLCGFAPAYPISNDYHLDLNRRIFDKTWEGKVGKRNDSRQHNIRRAKNPIDITSVKDTKHISAIIHE